MVNFRDLDLFGTKIEFKLDGEEKYKSKFGAVVSLIYLSSIIVIGSLCVKDFFDTKSLNVSYTLKEKDHTSADNLNILNNDNFYFAFQVVDAKSNHYFNDTNKVLYAIPIYSKGVRNQKTGQWTFNNKRLNIINCTKEMIGWNNENKFDYLSGFKCIDFDNISIGGGWSDSFNNYFTLNIKSCDISKVDNTTDNFFLEKDNILLILPYQQNIIHS